MMNFDAIYTDHSLQSPTNTVKGDNQVKYLETLYNSGTNGQKIWAREELLLNYAIEKPKVSSVTNNTATIPPTQTMVTSGTPLTSAGNTIETGQADTLKANPLPLLIIAFLVMLFLAD